MLLGKSIRFIRKAPALLTEPSLWMTAYQKRSTDQHAFDRIAKRSCVVTFISVSFNPCSARQTERILLMATIQFAIPERPPLHTGLPASEEQESAFQRWLHELRTRREEQPLSDPWAEVPFLIATFGSVYAEFTLVRSLG